MTTAAVAVAGGELTEPKGPLVPGTTVSVAGSGFDCTELRVTLGVQQLGEMFSIQPGAPFREDLAVPVDAPVGEQYLEVSCNDGADNVIQPVVVVAPAPPPPIASPQLTLAPATAVAGDVVTVAGTGFDSCIPPRDSGGVFDPIEVPIALGGAAATRGRLVERAPDRGTLGAVFTVPAGTDPGPHQIVATCTDRYRPGNIVTASATLTVRAPAGPSPTPVRPAPGGVQPGGGRTGGSTPYVPSASSDGFGTAFGVGGAVVVIAAIGAIALRRRVRPAGAATVHPPRTPGQQRPANVTARSAGLSSAPAQVRPGPGHDVSIRVVARSGSAR